MVPVPLHYVHVLTCSYDIRLVIAKHNINKLVTTMINWTKHVTVCTKIYNIIIIFPNTVFIWLNVILGWRVQYNYTWFDPNIYLWSYSVGARAQQEMFTLIWLLFVQSVFPQVSVFSRLLLTFIPDFVIFNGLCDFRISDGGWSYSSLYVI